MTAVSEEVGEVKAWRLRKGWYRQAVSVCGVVKVEQARTSGVARNGAAGGGKGAR